jgi:glycosyltransferase involved in cell wall biosynthesis
MLSKRADVIVIEFPYVLERSIFFLLMSFQKLHTPQKNHVMGRVYMLSVIISWYNRNELKKALPSIVENVRAVGGDITVVNFMGDSHWLEDQIQEYAADVRIVTVTDQVRFNKARAQNIGADATSKPVLFFCDCDIILSKGTLQNLLEQITTTPNSFATLKGVKETDQNARQANNLVMFGYELRLKIKDGTSAQIIDNEEDVTDGTRQAPGLLMVRREDFLKVNGYNGRLNGWGWEDQDMICRLTLHAKLKRITSGIAQHISHDDEARMQSYLGFLDRWQSRDKMFRTALSNYDLGDFLGTYTVDAEVSVCSAIS